MDTELKVTDQPEEIAFDDMVGGDNIINIPLFQRAYRWKNTNINEFWEDIESILDGSSKSHFLGVLVLVAQNRKVGQPVLLDVVDGQQRLTTCFLTVLAMVQVAAERGNAEWAVEVARGFLLTRRFSTYSTNTKLIPSAVDRQQFHTIWTKVANLEAVQKHGWAGEKPSPPQPSGNVTGRMISAYNGLVRRCREIIDDQGIDSLERVFEIIVGKLSFVTINLRNPTAAPTIFERLNARGERINISDLVRNEVFSRVAEDPALARNIFESHWEPFISKFTLRGTDLEKFLFPYGLLHDSNITKADLFQTLRRIWGEPADPRDIISSLDSYTDAFFVLQTGDKEAPVPSNLRDALLDLYDLGAPSSTYAFLVRLVHAVQQEEVPEAEAIAVTRMIESFLFRRAVAGIEPTGLHAVFKGLWSESSEHTFSLASVRDSIGRRTTVPWPNDEEFCAAITRGTLYGRRVDKYAIRQYELHADGESPIDDFEIEHILPTKPSADWEIDNLELAEKLKNTWGNLIPLSQKMNPSLSNSGFAKKRSEYARSIFSSPRMISSEFSEWNLEAIEKRSESISEWALVRWPHSRN